MIKTINKAKRLIKNQVLKGYLKINLKIIVKLEAEQNEGLLRLPDYKDTYAYQARNFEISRRIFMNNLVASGLGLGDSYFIKQ